MPEKSTPLPGVGRKEYDVIRRTRRVVIPGVAVLGLGLVGSAVGWRLHLSNEVKGRVRALQRAGLPTSGAELNDWYGSVPDSENAALVLTQAFALMRTFTDQRSNEISRFKPPLRGQASMPEQKVTIDSVPGLLPILARATGFFERDLRFYLDAMETNISIASQPYPRSLVACTNLAKQQDLAANRHHYILSGLLLPNVDRVLIREAECAARLIVAQTALAVERFRLANDRLPEGLTEAMPRFLPAVPLDPFDGAPLRYKRLDKGYVIYSIGPDGHDDGGKEPPTKRGGTERVPEDITITVER